MKERRGREEGEAEKEHHEGHHTMSGNPTSNSLVSSVSRPVLGPQG